VPMAEPAYGIKGTAIGTLVMVLNDLKRSGQASPELIEACLGPEEMALLDTEIQPALWYPLTAYEKLIELLYRADGHGRSRDQYFRWRGESVARRLCDQGLYHQLKNAREDDEDEGNRGAGITRLQVRITVSVWDAILNFTQWEFRQDPDDPCRFAIDVLNGSAVPEPLRHQTAGFVHCVLERLSDEAVDVSMQVDGDRLRYAIRMAKPLS